MASLWGDGWFYISALGFLGSGALFLYLLGQYRSAVEEAEEGDALSPSPEAGPLPARPLVVDQPAAPLPAPIVSEPKPKPAPAAALPVAAALPKPQEAAQPAAGYTGPDRRRSDFTSSGGISPAVVYMQNIKSQMERFEKEISALKALSAQQAAQGDLVLKRLSELADGLKTGASPRVALPAPTRSVELTLDSVQEEAPAAEPVELKPAKSVEPKRSAAPAPAPTLVPAQEPETKADASKTVVIEALPRAQAEPAAAAPSPAPEPDVQPSQPRKGPVWPV